MSAEEHKPTVHDEAADHDEVSRISEENLQAMAEDIDRQMKTLAEMDIRMLAAKEQLTEFQQTVREKIHAFQHRNDHQDNEGHSDILKSFREARDEAANYIKESKAINEAYEKLHKQMEKGREAAIRETRKAEAVFKEKFHEVEEKLVKKAHEIKENIKKK